MQSWLGGGGEADGASGGDGGGSGGSAPAYDSGPAPAAYDVSAVASPVSPMPSDPVPVVDASATTSLSGLWIAKPSDAVTIQLALFGDGNFVWTVLSDGTASGFRGTYQMDGSRMVLSASDKQLSGNVAVAGSHAFNFLADGSDANEPGLAFTR
jgi:hypothetical protein